MRVAFQEHTIEALNAVITRQQQQIDDLNKEQIRMKTYLQNLSPTAAVSTDQDPPPPHY